jgi:hypothetical protein
MVEPFNDTSPNNYNYKEIYDYIYGNFVVPNPDNYMQLNSKPLICFFNGNITSGGYVSSDSRFSTRIVGGSYYSNWFYDTIPGITLKSGDNVNNPTLGSDGEISVNPRFDDRLVRTPSHTYDVNYSKDAYGYQWNYSIDLARQGKINYVTISTWNEYAERTSIEPFYDNSTATGSITPQHTNAYYLFDKTQHYIAMIKSIPVISPSPSIPEFPSFLVIGLIMVSTFVGVLVYKRKHTKTQ